jgi:hypothetical protein
VSALFLRMFFGQKGPSAQLAKSLAAAAKARIGPREAARKSVTAAGEDAGIAATRDRKREAIICSSNLQPPESTGGLISDGATRHFFSIDRECLAHSICIALIGVRRLSGELRLQTPSSFPPYLKIPRCAVQSSRRELLEEVGAFASAALG